MNEPEQKPKRKTFFNKKLVTIVLVAILIIGSLTSLGLLWKSHQKQRDDSKKQVSIFQDKIEDLESKNHSLSQDLDEANKKLTDLENESEGIEVEEIPNLTVTVTGATKDSRGYVHNDTTKQVIIVDISVANKSGATTYLGLSDFKLKDSENHSYDVTGTCWPPAANKTELKAQSVASGETVSGSVCIANLSVYLEGLVLHYKEQTFDINPKDATYPTWW